MEFTEVTYSGMELVIETPGDRSYELVAGSAAAAAAWGVALKQLIHLLKPPDAEEDEPAREDAGVVEGLAGRPDLTDWFSTQDDGAAPSTIDSSLTRP